MMAHRKDGIDKTWPRVDAEGWKDAIELGSSVTETTTFEWSNEGGWFSLTIGFQESDGSGPLLIRTEDADDGPR